MGLEKVLCMTGGTGETSYAANSSFQKNAIEKVTTWLKESIKDLLSTTNLDCLTVADLGCSSGPNALAVLQSIIDAAVSTCESSGCRILEFNVFMNDLPQSDFNTLFKSLPSFYKKIEEEKGVQVPCFISGTPGSFYGRLFPCNSIHFMHSSYCLHWLSQVPEGLVGEDGKEALNNGCIYGRNSSPPRVLQAYRQQYTKDFTMFLRCRSKELVHGGRMLLTIVATHDDEISMAMEATNESLNKLASEGVIDKEKLDALNMPYYRPTVQQVKQLIEADGSFAIVKLHTFTSLWGYASPDDDEDTELRRRAKFMAKGGRAAIESILVAEFGDVVIDEIFRGVEELGAKYLSIKDAAPLNLVLSLVKRG